MSCKRWQIAALLSASFFFILWIAAHFFNVIQDLPLCGLRMLFGARCPGCGLTRSVLLAVQGHWQQSVQFHPLGVVMLGLLLVWPFAEWRAERLSQQHSSQLRLLVMLVLALAFLLVWLLRLVDFLPSPL